MSEPQVPPGPFHPGQPGPAGPFQPAPTRPGPGGCTSRPVLLGCAGLLVLLGIGAILFLVKAKDIARWSFQRMETEIQGRLPPDLTPAERQQLAAAFDAVESGLGSGQVDIAGMQSVQAKVLEIAGRPEGQKATREDVLELTRALEKLAGKPAVAMPEQPGAP